MVALLLFILATLQIVLDPLTEEVYLLETLSKTKLDKIKQGFYDASTKKLNATLLSRTIAINLFSSNWFKYQYDVLTSILFVEPKKVLLNNMSIEKRKSNRDPLSTH